MCLDHEEVNSTNTILVKDSVGRISKIAQPDDLQKFMR